MKRITVVGPLFLVMSLFFVVSAPRAQKHSSSDAAGLKIADDDVVRVSTVLVTLPVSVMDRHGRFVPDLRQEQFRLYEDGIEQEVAYFEGAEKAFTVALLLDTSDSVRFKLGDIQTAAIAFLDQLRPDDRIIVVAFDKRVTVLSEATNDRQKLSEAIRRARTGGGTSLYNAIDLVINQRLAHIRGRKAIVLFTDGVDTASLHSTYESTLHAAEELDALVYSIQYDTIDDAMKSVRERAGDQAVIDVTTAKGEPLSVAYTRANRYLRLLTDKTGGRFFYADTVKALTEVFDHIAKELRQQYSIGYYPKNRESEGKTRKVRVTVANAVVRTRRSYVYKPLAYVSEKK